ncbi:hypothetical protein GmRootV118_28220 [Variovorax sp. V118]
MRHVTEIEALLKSGKTARDEDVPAVLDQEIREAEATLGRSFPTSYREFIAFGGLGELRIRHRVLRPAEIVVVKRHTGAAPIVPFADNGCGDLYGWSTLGLDEPGVVLWNHDDGTVEHVADSFAAWLSTFRF